MRISQLYISDLETGRFEDVVVTRTITAHRLYSFKNLLSEGAVYELSVFYIARSNNHFKLCASPVCIRFTEHTSFVEVVDPTAEKKSGFASRLVLNLILGTQFYFYHESQATQYAGSAEQRVVPLAYLPKYGGVKKLESVRLSELNIYVLNSPLQHHASDDMSVAVKLSMVPNPVVKSSCSYHTNGPDDVPIIEGCPPSTGPEPAHTDSVLTSTETPIDDEKDPSSK
ncbi:unnamed protein product [Brassica oleracea]